jgi:hypothetical protein
MKNSGIIGPTPTGVNHRRLQISKYLASVTLKPHAFWKEKGHPKWVAKLREKTASHAARRGS